MSEQYEDEVERLRGALREVADVCDNHWLNLATCDDEFLRERYGRVVTVDDVGEIVARALAGGMSVRSETA